MAHTEVRLTYPVWAFTIADFGRTYPDDESRMGLALELARENVVRGWGGPFGAAVFESRSGKLLSIGVNSVVHMANSLMHAEVMALAMAHATVGSWTLGAGEVDRELVTTCEPCAMCLGATLWSGVRRLVCAATRDDAEAIGFDEGPVTAESYEHLARRGIAVVREVRRAEGRAVLESYRTAGGVVYNA